MWISGSKALLFMYYQVHWLPVLRKLIRSVISVLILVIRKQAQKGDLPRATRQEASCHLTWIGWESDPRGPRSGVGAGKGAKGS